MTTTSSIPTAQLDDNSRSVAIEELIESCLTHFNREDAAALSEAYYARTQSEPALYLLSQCMAQSARWEECYYVLKGGGLKSPRCRYVFAKAAFETGRASEAETALREPKEKHRVLLHSSFERGPDAPFAHALLAKIAGGTNRLDVAKRNLEDSLKLELLLLGSVKQYCEFGGENLKSVYQSVGIESAAVATGVDRRLPAGSKYTPVVASTKITPAAAYENARRKLVQPVAPKKKTSTPIAPTSVRKPRGVQAIKSETLEARRSPRLISTTQENENTATSRYSLRSSTLHPPSRSTTTRVRTGANTATAAALPATRGACKILFEESPNVEFDDLEVLKQDLRVRRTNAQPLSSVNTPNITPLLSSISTSTTSADGTFGCDEPMELENSDPSEQELRLLEKSAKEESVEKEEGGGGEEKEQKSPVDHVYRDILDWFLRMMEVQEHLSHYRCAEALALLNTTGGPFESTPLMLNLRAKAHFERADYKKACDVFHELRRHYPHRVDGMELYSTALWQLQDSHRLSALCAELSASGAREKPQTWCAIGNSLSLEKKHELAVEALERAIQLDPSFGYTYSLLGHELIDLNDLAKASQTFRKAIVYSPNDYRAWYGLGLVHFREEQLPLAKMNIQRAIRINPSNIVLLCQAAVIEQALHSTDAAMNYVEQALRQAPNNVACRYHKARLLFDTGSYKKALKELTELKSLSPDEAHVFFLLGRVHRKLGNNHMALLNFSWATEIDPRGEQNSSAISERVSYDDGPIDFNTPPEARGSNSSF